MAASNSESGDLMNVIVVARLKHVKQQPDVRLFGPALAWFDSSGPIRATARSNGESGRTAAS
jgi:hypothetical protein